MTIINNSHNFVFVHVPKTAGTSVTSALSTLTNYCDLEVGSTHFGMEIESAYRNRFGIHKHSLATEIRCLTGSVRWNKLFTFGFVRHPVERVKSTFHFLRQWSDCPEALKARMLSFTDVNEYVLSDIWQTSNGPSDLFRPQSRWLTSSDKVIVDFVGKVETLSTDMNHILSTVSAKQRDLEIPHLNTSRREDDNEQLSDQAIDKILSVYANDFRLFDYSVD